jgi:hypothetical protein
MSIIRNNQELEQAPYIELGKAECSYCDLVLTFPCVFWITGRGLGLYLHAACSRRWGYHLITDGNTAERMTSDVSRDEEGAA